MPAYCHSPCRMAEFASGRAKVLAVGTVLNWIADYCVVGSYLSLSHAMGDAGSFGLFAVINGLAWLFVYLCVPETRGVALEAARRPAGGADEAPASEASEIS